jgi:hypothetical protein
MCGMTSATFDKQEQYDKVAAGVLPGEQILAVYDALGAGTGFIALTTRRGVLQDNSFMGKKTAVTSLPYRRVTAVSFVSDKSMLGRFATTSAVAGCGRQARVRGAAARRGQGARTARRHPVTRVGSSRIGALRGTAARGTRVLRKVLDAPLGYRPTRLQLRPERPGPGPCHGLAPRPGRGCGSGHSRRFS